VRARFPRPLFCPDMRSVEADRRPVDLAERVEFGEQESVESVPDSGLAPAAEPPPAGDAGSESELGRQVLPIDPGVEHEQDALQAFSVIERARSALPRPMDRQLRLGSSPQRPSISPGLALPVQRANPKPRTTQTVHH